MQTSAQLIKGSDVKVEVGTVLSYRPLLDAEAWHEGLLNEFASEEMGDSYHELGLTRVSSWLQRDPDAAIIRWEGSDVDTLFERWAASSNPVLARWRGQFRVNSGPQEAENFWDASRHRLFSWTSEEEGEDSEIRVFRGTSEMQSLFRLYEDVSNDNAHFEAFDRIRRSQGFTRIETWTQQVGEETLMLNLFEAHDLASSLLQVESESNSFDRRLMDTRRAAVEGPPLLAHHPGKLIADWRG
jgi:hypothetical protein